MYIMNRDPYYYLNKAEYFYKLARKNGYDASCDYNLNDEDLNDIDNYYICESDDDLIDDYENECIDEENDDYENEYIDEKEKEEGEEENDLKKKINIKPAYRRYYDPVTKHYYKTERIFDTNNSEKSNQMIQSNPDIWYPENKLSFKTMHDPITGKYYRVNKIYDKNGNYSYKYNKLNNRMQKKPGTDYYVPIYSSNNNDF